jgi:hypothetical protein
MYNNFMNLEYYIIWIRITEALIKYVFICKKLICSIVFWEINEIRGTESR